MVTVRELVERLTRPDVPQEADVYLEAHCCGGNSRLYYGVSDTDPFVDVLTMSNHDEEQLVP